MSADPEPGAPRGRHGQDPAEVERDRLASEQAAGARRADRDAAWEGQQAGRARRQLLLGAGVVGLLVAGAFGAARLTLAHADPDRLDTVARDRVASNQVLPACQDALVERLLAAGEAAVYLPKMDWVSVRQTGQATFSYRSVWRPSEDSFTRHAFTCEVTLTHQGRAARITRLDVDR